MKYRPEILDEIMFYILERTKCEEDPEKYLEHVIDYCKKDYQKAYKKLNGFELTIVEIKQKYENERKKLIISNFLQPIGNKSLFLFR